VFRIAPLSVAIPLIAPLLLTSCNPEPEFHWTDLEQLPNSDLYMVQRGQVPIIITAPHAGWMAPEGVARRNCNAADAPVECRGGPCTEGGTGPEALGGADGHSLQIAEDLALELEACAGGAPYVVIGKVSREYVDFNRDADDPKGGERCAMDDHAARPLWDGYHERIRRAVADAQALGAGPVLLIDVHGFGGEGRVLSAGTGSPPGLTLPFRGADLLFNPLRGFAPLVELKAVTGLAHGALDVVPDGVAGDYEGAPNGGFTVRRYSGVWGSVQDVDRVDGLQLEFSGALRASEAPEALAQVTAEALCAALEL
jgi:hypothetical protein